MKTEKQILQLEVGRFCKDHRETVLNLSLQELSDDSGINYKTLYSFESGLSSNLYIFFLYYNRSPKPEMFLNELLKTVGDLEW